MSFEVASLKSNMHDGGLTLPDSVYGDAWTPKAQEKPQATAAAAALKKTDIPVPDWLDKASWEQLQSIIDQAEKDGKKINFTTPSENAANSDKPGFHAPDYRLVDGKLVKTGNPPSADGSINIQVESQAGETQAKQYSIQLQKMSIQERINYCRAYEPNNTGRLQALMDDMEKVGQAVPSDVKWPVNNPPPNQQPVETVPPDPQTDVGGGPSGTDVGPTGGDVAPTGGDAGPVAGGPGGADFTPGNSQWRDHMGQPPSHGYTPGDFNPSDADQSGPLDPSQIPKPVAGDLVIKFQGDTPPSGITPQEIQQFLQSMGSPAANEPGFAKALYDMGIEHHIDPAVALGFFYQESTCGKAGRAVANHSFGNIIGSGPAGSDGKFRRYHSWAEGAADWYNLIDKYNARGLTTLSQVIHTYAPSGDGNNEQHYRQTVKAMVQKFADANAAKTATA